MERLQANQKHVHHRREPTAMDCVQLHQLHQLHQHQHQHLERELSRLQYHLDQALALPPKAIHRRQGTCHHRNRHCAGLLARRHPVLDRALIRRQWPWRQMQR